MEFCMEFYIILIRQGILQKVNLEWQNNLLVISDWYVIPNELFDYKSSVAGLMASGIYIRVIYDSVGNGNKDLVLNYHFDRNLY